MSWPAGQPKSDPAHSYIHWRAERLPPPCLLGVLQFASSHLFLLVVLFSVTQESGIRYAKSLAQLHGSVQWMTEQIGAVSRCATPYFGIQLSCLGVLLARHFLIIMNRTFVAPSTPEIILVAK